MLTTALTALARAAAFMPQLKAANEKLRQDMQVLPREQFDIEAVDDEQPHIVMVRLQGAQGESLPLSKDLALGVLEEKLPLDETSLRMPAARTSAPDAAEVIMPRFSAGAESVGLTPVTTTSASSRGRKGKKKRG